MFDKPIDFDRFVRIIITVANVITSYFLLRELSSVLLPFFLAWLTAYMLEPLVLVMQKWVRKRILAVLFTLVLIAGLVTILAVMLTPLIIDEVLGLQSLIASQLNSMAWPNWIPKDIGEKVNVFISGFDFSSILEQYGIAEKAASVLYGGWNLVSGAVGALGALFGIVTYALYVVFIMLDYAHISSSWKKLIPEKYQSIVFDLVDDMEKGMNGYFKAQTNIVLIVAIAFSIGFSLIGLPFAIVLGITLGLMNYIPYAQLIGIIPAVGLTALHSIESGESFWTLLSLMALVFVVVQLAQDLYLTPKFMGSFSGFNPAIILLSLSVWGSLLGIIGLVIGIPLTSIILSYYQRDILKREA